MKCDSLCVLFCVHLLTMCFVLGMHYSLVYSLAGEPSLTLRCSVTRLTTAGSGTTVLSIHWLATPTTCTWLWTWGSSLWTSPYAEGLNRCLHSSLLACKQCPLGDCSVTADTCAYTVCRCQLLVQGGLGPFLLS